jgi:hypothetical protein
MLNQKELKMNKLLYLSLILLSVSGCVSFVDTSIDTTLPQDVTDRNHVVITADWRDELVELSGTVLYEPKDPKQRWRAGRRIISGTEPKLLFIASDDPNRVLAEVMIDSSSSNGLSAIGLGSIAVTGKDKLDFKYEDVSRVFINWADIDHSTIMKEKKTAMPDDAKRRWFVQGVRLATIHHRRFTEVTGKFNKTVGGEGIGVNGDVFNASRKLTRDFAIHVTLRDIDRWPNDPMNKNNQKKYFIKQKPEIKGLSILLDDEPNNKMADKAVTAHNNDGIDIWNTWIQSPSMNFKTLVSGYTPKRTGRQQQFSTDDLYEGAIKKAKELNADAIVVTRHISTNQHMQSSTPPSPTMSYSADIIKYTK